MNNNFELNMCLSFSNKKIYVKLNIFDASRHAGAIFQVTIVVPFFVVEKVDVLTSKNIKQLVNTSSRNLL